MQITINTIAKSITVIVDNTAVVDLLETLTLFVGNEWKEFTITITGKEVITPLPLPEIQSPWPVNWQPGVIY